MLTIAMCNPDESKVPGVHYEPHNQGFDAGCSACRDELVRKLRGEGTAALIVDKEIHVLLELADRHLIMVKGRIVFSGTSAEWRARADENLALLRA